MPPPVEQTICNKVADIKLQPYAKYINSEDVLSRNFGYKIVRQEVSSGKNSVIYKCESLIYPDLHCIVKAYKFGKEKIKLVFKEDVCQIMRYVSGKCPQIISTVDMFYTSEKIYLMCDWTNKGEVLVNIKQKTFNLNEQILHSWAIDILGAINFLHGNGICHRNIAPSCLLLTHENRVKIGTLSDAMIYCKPDGTLIMPKWPKFSKAANWNQGPEVAKGRPYDPRSADIWSIGATIFWFITHSYPIDYRSGTKLPKQLERRLGYMRKVSNKCQTFVKRMLNYQPSGRPTVTQALQIEWVTISAKVTTKAETDISVTEKKTQDPGDAVGPEDLMAELESSKTPKKEAAEITQEKPASPQ